MVWSACELCHNSTGLAPEVRWSRKRRHLSKITPATSATRQTRSQHIAQSGRSRPRDEHVCNVVRKVGRHRPPDEHTCKSMRASEVQAKSIRQTHLVCTLVNCDELHSKLDGNQEPDQSGFRRNYQTVLYVFNQVPDQSGVRKNYQTTDHIIT